MQKIYDTAYEVDGFNESSINFDGVVKLKREEVDNKKIIIMHPGPINRGVELTSDVLVVVETETWLVFGSKTLLSTLWVCV